MKGLTSIGEQLLFLAIYNEIANLLKCELNVEYFAEYFRHKLNQFINGILRNVKERLLTPPTNVEHTLQS